jgi:glycosyltransferase involved in cell wall biosynthesis
MKYSFIVIGKNEGWKLKKCFESIERFISGGRENKYEIIYVDSKSEDKSVEIAKSFKKVRVFLLTEGTNPAIARNVGAQSAIGKALIFLDGDMEINVTRFREIFDDKDELKNSFISGDYENWFYANIDDPNSSTSKVMQFNLKSPIYSFVTGGLFAINRETWESIGGMRMIFEKGEDHDLGLRLAKKGVKLLRLPINLVFHHTISYYDKSRLWSDLKDSTFLYGRSLLYRKNFSNKYTYRLIIKHDYSMAVLAFVLILGVSLQNPTWILLYISIILARSLMKKNLAFFPYFLFRDIKVLTGIFFFYPKLKTVRFEEIKS